MQPVVAALYYLHLAAAAAGTAACMQYFSGRFIKVMSIGQLIKYEVN